MQRAYHIVRVTWISHRQVTLDHDWWRWSHVTSTLSLPVTMRQTSLQQWWFNECSEIMVTQGAHKLKLPKGPVARPIHWNHVTNSDILMNFDTGYNRCRPRSVQHHKKPNYTALSLWLIFHLDLVGTSCDVPNIALNLTMSQWTKERVSS